MKSGSPLVVFSMWAGRVTAMPRFGFLWVTPINQFRMSDRSKCSGLIPSREMMTVVPLLSRERCLHYLQRLTQRHLFSSEDINGAYYVENHVLPSQEELENREGVVLIRQTQRTVPIDTERTTQQVRELLRLADCSNMDVGIWLSSDRTVRRLNTEYRHKRKSTDILSFPFHEELTPGEKPQCSTDDDLNLGDMILSVPYIARCCERDFKHFQRVGEEAWREEALETRGVSGAMMYAMSAEQRVPLLLIHGLCHLRGYDHEDDDEFLEMVTEEERLLRGLVEAGFFDSRVLAAIPDGAR